MTRPPLAPVPDDATARQRHAADPAASVWVGASAGTGKTKVLTDRVLALLLAGTPPHKLLCLTYTRAAAAEMAIRVQRELGRLALAKEADLDHALSALGAAADATTRARARRLFAQVLDCPGGLKIQTIHAFCESLLRRFPVEAGLAPHFQLLDDTEQQALLFHARDEVLARAVGTGAAGSDDALARAVERVAGRLNADSFNKLMGILTRERGRIARLLALEGGLDGAIAALCARLGVRADDTEASVIAAACADAAFDAPALRRAAAVLDEGGVTDKKKASAMTPFLAADISARPGLYEAYLGGFLTAKGEAFKTMITGGALKGADRPDVLIDAMQTEAERLLAVEDRRRAVRTAQASIAALTIGAALIETYAARKAQAARLDYDDLILHARELLATREATQWVLFKLDGGIDHVLVDEAQDTSPEQWDVVRRLTGEFFAGLGARAERDETARTMFAVGDAKQSIYSFQRADPRAFSEMREAYRSDVAAVGGDFRDVLLQHSFRSVAPVLAAVDRVFANAPASAGVADGEAVRHVTSRAGQAGRVEIWPAFEPGDDVPADPWDPDPEAEAARSAEVALAAFIAQQVKEWNGVLDLPSRGRKLRAGDVLVLVRRRTRLVNQLVRAFKRLEVGVTGVDRMKLASELAVMDLVALARFLVLPEDDYSLACVLKGPFCGCDDDDLITLAPARKGTLWAELSARAGERARWLAARDFLARLLARTDYLRPFELFAQVLDEHDGRARLIARLGAEAEDPVDEFLELALAFERIHAPSLQGFLDWFESGQSDIKRDLEQASLEHVRIMTVHGAKGLQAPLVILPDTMGTERSPEAPYWCESPRGGEMPLWTPKAGDLDPVGRALRQAAAAARDEEHHRLLYVAMTRAEDMLFIGGWKGRKAAPAGCWYNLVRDGLKGTPGVAPFTFNDPLTGFEGEGLRLEAAQTEEPDRKSDGEVEAAEFPRRAPERWETDPAPSEGAAAALAPSAAEGEPALISPLAGDQSARFLKGRLVHGLLEFLPSLAPAARAGAAERFLARPALGLDAAAQADIVSETLALFDDPAFGGLFGADSLAEVPITARFGTRVVNGQIDRLLVRDGEILAVDYKTARPVPADASKVPSAYVAQMALYRAALGEIFPGRTVRCALLYTASARLVEVPPELMDAVLAGAKLS
jgi:ATP-dependent helicase/nuclease subunit A